MSNFAHATARRVFLQFSHTFAKTNIPAAALECTFVGIFHHFPTHVLTIFQRKIGHFTTGFEFPSEFSIPLLLFPSGPPRRRPLQISRDFPDLGNLRGVGHKCYPGISATPGAEFFGRRPSNEGPEAF